MAPPEYTDLGKKARDLFRAGYHPGLWQLDCKTLTSSGIEFFTSGFANQDASKVKGSLQSKYKVEDYGITLTERWNTENLLFGQIMQRDKLSEGLMLLAEASFQPSSGDKSAKFLADLARDNFNILGQLGVNKGETYVAGSLVLAHKEFYGGVNLDYNIDNENLLWKLGLGFTNESTTVHSELVNADGWLVSLFHKASEAIDLGFEIGKPIASTNADGEQQATDLFYGLGMIYHLEGDALIRAKNRIMDALVKMVYYYIITKRQEGQKRNDKGQIIDERSKNSNNNIEEDSKRIFRNSSKGLNGSEETEYIPIPVLDGNMLTYFHIGNLAKQCLCHGYKIGVWQLDCTSKAKEILSLNNYGQADPDFYNVSGGVSLIEKFGILNMSQTWQTDGYIGTIGLDTEAKGRKLYSILSGNYLRDGDPGPKVELFAGYERSPIKSEVVIPILKSPTLMGYLLFQPKEHFVFACRMEFNVEDREIETHAFSIGYNDDITEYMLKIENFTDVRGSVFQRIGDKWAVALKANLFGKDMQKFTVGGQYQLNENALIKARICSIGLIGLVYQFKITENVKGNYYFGLDASSPLKGDHKIGISWKFKS